jgi:6-phosphogluconate dehydrogenase (decarboxylating)
MSQQIEKSGHPLYVGAFAKAFQKATAAAAVAIDVSAVICDATAAAFTLTLPSAALHAGRVLDIKQNASANLVTLAPVAGETVSAGASYVGLSAAGKFVRLIANGLDWTVLANN